MKNSNTDKKQKIKTGKINNKTFYEKTRELKGYTSGYAIFTKQKRN